MCSGTARGTCSCRWARSASGRSATSATWTTGSESLRADAPTLHDPVDGAGRVVTELEALDRATIQRDAVLLPHATVRREDRAVGDVHVEVDVVVLQHAQYARSVTHPHDDRPLSALLQQIQRDGQAVHGVSTPMIRFEDQLFRQGATQPEPGPSERLQAAGALRTAAQMTHFGPLFLHQAGALEQRIRAVLPNVQSSALLHDTPGQLSQLVQAVRSTRPLPMTVAAPPGARARLPLRPRGVYDQDFVVIAPKVDHAALMEGVRAAIGVPSAAVRDTFYGCAVEVGDAQKVEGIAPVSIPAATEPIQYIETPDVSTMDELEAFMKIPKAHMLKLVCYELAGRLVLVHIRGDLAVSPHRLGHVLGVNPFEAELHLRMAPLDLLEAHGLVSGYGGFYGAKGVERMHVVFDESVRDMRDCVLGGNRAGYHYAHYDYARDSKEHLAAITFADIAEREGLRSEGVLVEGVLLRETVPLMGTGAGGGQQQCQMFCLRVRYLEVLQSTPVEGFQAVYCMHQIPAKFADQQAAAQAFLDAVNTAKHYVVVDDRPKVPFAKKLEAARAGVFRFILVLNKNTEPGATDGYVWDPEAGDYVERRVGAAELE